MLLVPDHYEDKFETIKSFKYVTVNKHGVDIRLDRIDLKMENGHKIIERMTHFGNSYAQFFDIDEFLFSKTNIDTKEVDSVETSIVNGINGLYGRNNVTYPQNFVGIDGETENFPFINKAIYNIGKLNGYIPRSASLSNNCHLQNVAYDFEDRLNIEYSGLVGILSAIITQSSISIPFRADIIIDSQLGINIKNLKLIFNDTDIKEAFSGELKSFYNALNVVYRSVKQKYEKENRRIRIYAAVREFDSFITIKDTEYDIEYKFHLNNSDHARSLYTTIAHLGPRWFDKEEFGDLMETKCKTIIPAMFEMQDEQRRFTFENVDYTDNFPFSYN